MSLFKFNTCTEACTNLNVSCPNKECRNWINYEDDLNCAKICAERNGPLTLREVSSRLGCSFVRVKQIEEEVMKKLKIYIGYFMILQKLMKFLLIL